MSVQLLRTSADDAGDHPEEWETLGDQIPIIDNFEGTGASVFATRSLTIAVLIVAGGLLGSRLLGLLRSVIIANTFGTQPELDAYWVVFRLPDLVFQLLAGATLASAFIPMFAGIRARDGEAASGVSPAQCSTSRCFRLACSRSPPSFWRRCWSP